MRQEIEYEGFSYMMDSKCLLFLSIYRPRQDNSFLHAGYIHSNKCHLTKQLCTSLSVVMHAINPSPRAPPYAYHFFGLINPCCLIFFIYSHSSTTINEGAQWLSGRVLDSRPKGSGFEPHRRHCVVVLEQDTFILAWYWLNPGRTVPHN